MHLFHTEWTVGVPANGIDGTRQPTGESQLASIALYGDGLTKLLTGMIASQLFGPTTFPVRKGKPMPTAGNRRFGCP
jgi:hypothetical protein